MSRKRLHTGCLNGCDSPHYAKGYCCSCYWKAKYEPRQPKYGKRIKVYAEENNISLACAYNRLNNGVPLDAPTTGLKCGENNWNWKGGVWGYRNYQAVRKMRPELLAKYPLCQVCNTSPSKQIHHIDGSRDNHNPSNLLVVCVKCHASFRKKSKYIRLYGKTLQELAVDFGVSVPTIKKYLDTCLELPAPISKIKFLEVSNA